LHVLLCIHTNSFKADHLEFVATTATSAASLTTLTEEQRERIEQNRFTALAKKRAREYGSRPDRLDTSVPRGDQTPDVSDEQRTRIEQNRTMALAKKREREEKSRQGHPDIPAQPSETKSDAAEEQRARIEQNRCIALSRKRDRADSSCLDHADTSVLSAQSSPDAVATSEVLQTVATPMHVKPAQPAASSSSLMTDCEPRDLEINEVEASSDCRSIRGTIKERRDHQTGGGFRLKLGDATGEINITFFESAAEMCFGKFTWSSSHHSIFNCPAQSLTSLMYPASCFLLPASC
jgi:hypothetical protein